MRPASSFFTEPTRRATGTLTTPRSASGSMTARAISALAAVPAEASSHISYCSGLSTAGVRSWISVSSPVAAWVRMAAVSISSPSGPIQVDHSPAKIIGAPSFSVM